MFLNILYLIIKINILDIGNLLPQILKQFYSVALYVCFQIKSQHSRAIGGAQIMQVCQICTKVYRGKSALRNIRSHLFSAHGVGDPRYKCLCNKTFIWHGDFYFHKKNCPAFKNKEKETESTGECN